MWRPQGGKERAPPPMSLHPLVQIVMRIPKISAKGKTKNLRTHQILPPRDTPVIWYRTVAMEKIKKHGAIYLTPFSHRLAEEIDDPELQGLRCRVNYHARRFKSNVMKTSSEIVNKLYSEGHSCQFILALNWICLPGTTMIKPLCDRLMLKRMHRRRSPPLNFLSVV